MPWLRTIAHPFAVAREAIRAEKGQPKKPRRSRDELAFLPAVLEVTDTPPAPIGRAILWTIMLFVAIAAAWAWLGTIDINASAQARLIPSGRVKVIQPAAIGVVTAIHVRDGQQVKAGDTLIELDPTDAAADIGRLERDLLEIRMTIARLRALLADPVRPVTSLVPPKGAGLELVDLHKALLTDAADELRARIAGLDNQIAQRRAEEQAVQASITSFGKTLPLMRERVDAVKILTDQGHFPRLRYLELQQQLIEQEDQLRIEHHRLRESKEAILALEEERRRTGSEFRRDVRDQLAEADRQAVALIQERSKAFFRRKQNKLTAPIDGVVQQLQIHTVGGVVQPAEQLMVIVPNGAALEVEAMVLNKDIGFVSPGQAADIKLEAFPFTRYGSIEGKIVDVSNDAVQDENLGLVYTARISMSRTTMRVDGKEVNLAPGMMATADIRTGERQVIEFILSPLLRYRDESLRER